MRQLVSSALLVLTMVAAPGGARTVTAQELAAADMPRGPRFLVASNSKMVPVDVNRTPVLARRIKLDYAGGTLGEALADITAQSGLRLVYGNDVVPLGRRLEIRADGITVAAALTDVLFGTDVDVVFDQHGNAALVRRPAPAQNGTVQGRVTDAKTGQGLGDAEVFLEGTGSRALTTAEGRFRIAEVAPGSYTLAVRRLGYQRTTRPVGVADGQEVTVDVALVPAPTKLEEVVVTGAVAPTEVKALPTPVSVVTAADIEAQHATNISQVIRQAVPSAVAWDFGTDPQQTSLAVRGAAGLNPGGGSMKVYVDGIQVADRTLAAIEPTSIERVEVVRGPQAATIYGSDAIGGVIQVFTKRGDGNVARPRVELSAAAGALQSAYETTDRQEFAATVSGGTANASYNIGGNFSRHGEWIPEGDLQTLSGFGGVRIANGPLILDLSARHMLTRTPETNEPRLNQAWPGAYGPPHNLVSYRNETYGANLTYTAASWWKHQVTAGVDQAPIEAYQREARLQFPGDTLRFVYRRHARRVSLGYNTSAVVPLGAAISATITAGADHYSFASDGFSTSGAYNVEGPIRTDPAQAPSAQAGRVTNTGYFAQAMLGIVDQVFITGGVRAERNSSFGGDLGTPLSPRVGISYVRPVGSAATLKLRGSYGEAINPPSPGARDASLDGTGNGRLANPDLGPERQRGWDVGAEVVIGRYGSVGVTYYRQIAEDLINYVILPPSGGKTLSQYQNVGRVNNHGLEVEGSLALGPMQLQAQYAYTASRAEELGDNYTGDLRAGEQLMLVPRHTAGASLTFTPSRQTSVTAGLTYVGSWRYYDNYGIVACFGGTGPCQPTFGDYVIDYPAIAKFNLSATQQITPLISGFLTVSNATNNLRYEFGNSAPVIGRVTMAGLRIRY